ncbi:hypothetical protein BOTBODRAFT_37770 [Botryobasidium botryosum FD-172 SS1]|uniref:Cytochrome P450 n=1 Tax=Botryobasidium botryosum (strain FD-172 SS1) TaxID=930990 RepID=A0A067LZB8_BOTB1|nr:hypothetical protein BOTBODRAFT_37770 [Botryobasidium botryosum FD-172 SS1]
MLSAAIALLFLLLAARSVLKFLSGLKAVDNVPGFRCAFSATSLPGLFFPTSLNTLWCNPGPDFLIRLRHSLYPVHEIVSVVPFLSGAPGVYVCSIELMRQIAGYSPQYDKEHTFFDAAFGTNVVTAQRAGWKRHRRVINPAFSHKMYDLVWKESLAIFRDMVAAEGWEERDSTSTVMMNSITIKFALAVISSCAFGLTFPWAEPPKSEGGGMTLQDCLVIATRDVPLRIVAPRWVYRLPSKYLKEVEEAFTTVFAFAKSQIAARREKLADDKSKSNMCDLIVRANEDDGKVKLNDDEMLGDVFAVLIAGHETSGKVLTAIIALLGLHQDEQERVHQEILSVLASGREPSLDDLDSFPYLHDCIMEGIRLFPPADILVREATEDVFLKVPSRIPGQRERDVTIKKGTIVGVDVVGINHNPRYFPDPEAFKPSRWKGITEPDQFVGFGYGPRACVGRKFAMIELTCFLVLLIRDWRVEVVLKKGESLQQWRERILVAKVDITLGVGPTPIRLVRRKAGDSV